MTRIITPSLALLSILSTASLAETNALCPPPQAPRISTMPLASEETRIRADQVSGKVDDKLEFSGSVELENASQWIAADKITVTSSPRYVIAEENLQAASDGFLVSGEKALYNEQEDRIEFDNVRYQLPQKKVFGKAERINQQGKVISMNNASYTTCPSETPAWSLQAGKISLDQTTNVGTLNHATLRFEDVPVFYLPWATFPLDDQRKTGLLYPHLASTDSSGLEFGMPFYWNIRPNLDATISPIWIEERGLMWDNEFRFLYDGAKGTIRHKSLRSDNKSGIDRELLAAKLESRFSDHWRLDLDTLKVSDNNWFDDFSNDLNLTSLSHLSRRMDLNYNARNTRFQARLQDYQTINDDIAAEDTPYRQWPRLTYDTRRPMLNHRLEWSLASELIRFDHNQRQSGNRFDFNPGVSYSWRNQAAYLRPRLQWHFTHYELDSGEEFPESSINRELTTLSLDSGLFFERFTRSGDTQTLEPRLFYVNTPYRDQSQLPVFDTSDSSFSYYSLFRENQFNGIDRIADANQLTLATTTRRVNKNTGHVPWKASLGQILYFDDRRVQLPGEPEGMSKTSSYAAEVGYDPEGPWDANASILFSSNWDSTEALTLLGRYRGTNDRILNLEYRYRQDDIEQTNLSFVWPVHRRWNIMGRWLRSLEDARDIETIVGLEYDTCCWKMQLVNRRYALADQGEYNTGLYLQLILKGLSSQGSASNLLETSITGYKSTDE